MGDEDACRGITRLVLSLLEAHLHVLLAATAPAFLHQQQDPARRARLRLAPWQLLLHRL